MNAAHIISSQRYLNGAIVAEKIETSDFAVQLVAVELENVSYLVVVDGHHSLAAARAFGADIEWEILDSAHELSQAARRDPEAFLEASHCGDDYYFVKSGARVW